MKKIILAGITIYQIIISPLKNQLIGTKATCRYELSCSSFAKEIIGKEGVIKGGYKACIRILKCNPFINAYESI